MRRPLRHSAGRQGTKGNPMSSKKYQLSNNLGAELVLVAGDGIHFRLFGLSTGREPQQEALLVHVQAASPPPDGVDGTSLQELRKQKMTRRHVPALQEPASESIVLDQEIPIPLQGDTEEVVFSEEKLREAPVSFLTNRDRQEGEASFSVDYYDEYQLRWDRPLSPRAWVAISFDRFHPESSAIVAQVTDEWLFEPSEQQATLNNPVHERIGPSIEMPEYIRPEGPERQWAEPLLEFARRNGWTFDEAARLSVETVRFLEQQDREGVTVIVRPPPGRTRRERRARGPRRIRFAFKNPRLSQPENLSPTSWRWWQ
jgi:hypothetical protein